MTDEDFFPEWARVKCAAILGVGTPVVASFGEKLGPVLDILIKAGQVGVALVTILYIFSKWRKNRKK